MCFFISSCTATEENTNQVAIVDENPGILSQIKHGLLVTGATAIDLGVVAGGAFAYTGCTGLASGAGPLAPIGGSFCSTAFDTAVQALRPTAMNDYSLTKTTIGAQAITIVNVAKGLSGSDSKNLGQATINAVWTFGKHIAYDKAATKVCTEIAQIGHDYDSEEVLKKPKAFFPGDQELTKEFLEKWVTQSCKSMTIQGINNLEQTVVKSYEASSKTNAAFKKYQARCKAEGRKPIDRHKWEKKFDSLKKARAVKAKAQAEAAKAEAKKKAKPIVEEKMTYQIFVSNGQKTYVIDVDKDMSLYDLGKVIKKSTGNEFDYFTFSSRRHQFDETTTIEQARIGKGNTLNLQIRLCGGGCDRPDGRGSSRDDSSKRFTGKQHRHEEKIRQIEKELENPVLDLEKEIALRKDQLYLQFEHLDARYKNLPIDPNGDKVFDDGIQQFNNGPESSWNHAGAIVFVLKKTQKTWEKLGNLIKKERRERLGVEVLRIEERKNILEDSKYIKSIWDRIEYIKDDITKIAKRSNKFVADVIGRDSDGLYTYMKPIEKHHIKIQNQVRKFTPNLVRQRSLEDWENFANDY